MGELPHLGLYRRGTAAALVIAPALLLVDNVLHPKELARGNELEQVGIIASHYTRWQLAHALAFVGVVVFVAAVLGLAFAVRRTRPRLGLVAGALSLAGLCGFAALIALDGYTWAVVGASSTDPAVGPRAAAAVLDRVQNSGWSYLYYLTPLPFLVGFTVLSVSAARAGVVSTAAGVLLVVATVMVATETVIASNAYFVAGAAVLTAGGVAAAMSVLALSDEQFAAGGRAQAGS